MHKLLENTLFFLKDALSIITYPNQLGVVQRRQWRLLAAACMWLDVKKSSQRRFGGRLNVNDLFSPGERAVLSCGHSESPYSELE